MSTYDPKESERLRQEEWKQDGFFSRDRLCGELANQLAACEQARKEAVEERDRLRRLFASPTIEIAANYIEAKTSNQTIPENLRKLARLAERTE